ncbi:MAG: hypothetical protein FJ040_14565 [Chloroflexi bacterium]|nr:hypothetical protein [Chloroflexota bacterium]
MMSDAQSIFIHAISQRYGWGAPLRITPHIGGYVADVFLIETATHVGWLKCYDRQRVITDRVLAHATFYLHVTHWLSQHSALAKRITAPIPTLDGQFVIDSGHRYVAIMFTYVQGMTLRESTMTDAQRHHLVTTVALLHRATAEVPMPTNRVIEDFAAPWAPRMARMLDDEWHQCAPDVQALVTPYRHSLQSLLVQFVHAELHYRMYPPPMVLCHTDIHGYNIIVDGDHTTLLDFEGLKIAPVEHDFMFWVDDNAWPDMLACYHETRPHAVPQPALVRFYQVRRLLEDVYDYLEQIIVEQPVGDTRAHICESLSQMLVHVPDLSVVAE